MSKLQDFAVYVTSAQKSSFSGLDSNSRLEVVKSFYKSNSLEFPASITITTTKRGSYLTKDEKLALQMDYIKALQSGNVTPEVEANFEAVTNPDKVVTFTENLPYSEAVKTWGGAVVAAKMIDALPVDLNDEFHKVRKFDVPASVAISEIPAFIAELTKIYESNK